MKEPIVLNVAFTCFSLVCLKQINEKKNMYMPVLIAKKGYISNNEFKLLEKLTPEANPTKFT